MKLVTFTREGAARTGALVTRGGQDYVLDLPAVDPTIPGDVAGLLAAGSSVLEAVRKAVAEAPAAALAPLAEVTLSAPVPNPGKIICLGHNYRDNTGGASEPPPFYPTIFAKYANTVIGPGQPIVIPPATQAVDYEAELACVIGRRARRVPEAEALDYVAGYTIFNDVSARDYQRRTSQWTLGKSFDTFGPMGPVLVLADEIPDPAGLELWLTVNGEERQRSNSRYLIFSVPYLIAYLSEVMTLEPGDLISTGTPGGIGSMRNPPVFLKPGDEVHIHIDGIGDLVNPVVAG